MKMPWCRWHQGIFSGRVDKDMSLYDAASNEEFLLIQLMQGMLILGL